MNNDEALRSVFAGRDLVAEKGKSPRSRKRREEVDSGKLLPDAIVNYLNTAGSQNVTYNITVNILDAAFRQVGAVQAAPPVHPPPALPSAQAIGKAVAEELVSVFGPLLSQYFPVVPKQPPQ